MIKLFEEPTIEVVRFSVEDVITTSTVVPEGKDETIFG